MSLDLTLVLGGARSGKSELAERLAATGQRVLYLATAEALDGEMRARVEAHQARRPSSWATLEEPLDPAAALAGRAGSYDTLLLEDLTLWVSNLLLRWEHDPRPESRVLGQVDALVAVAAASRARWVVVSGEVGLGVVPASPLGRRYRDLLGLLNRAVAERASRVLLVVAGIPLDLGALRAADLHLADPRDRA